MFTLRVAGMTCASCVATIEKALRATPGVHGATVNLATGKAQVHGAPDLARDALVEAVKGSGYSVKEPTPTLDEEESNRTETIRLIVVAALTIPLVAVAMGPHIMMLFSGGSMEGMDGMDMEGMEGMTAEEMAAMGMDMGDDEAMATPYPWLQFALATPVVIFGGAPFLRGAWNAFRKRHLTMDSLVATGMVTAFGYSTAVLVFPALDSGQGVYFETAAVIVTLLLLGRRIEQGAQRRARATLRRLLEPVGGQPTATGQLLEDAQVSKIPIQQAVDRVVRYFVPTVLAIAVAASVFWMTLGAPVATEAGFTPSSMALMSLIAVLIIACPCALGLAVPMAVLTGTSRGAESGLIIRGGDALQASRGIDTVVVKSRGVVTTGNPAVTDLVPYGRPAADVLALASAVEGLSNHPVAVAIRRHAQTHSVPSHEASSFQGHPGRGAQATVNGTPVVVGRLEWLTELGIDTSPAAAEGQALRSASKTVVGVSQGGVLIGVVAVADPVRPTSKQAIVDLQGRGFEVILMSGDSPATANALAASLGIHRVVSRAAAEKQGAAIQALKDEGKRVAVVGDAVQDAPAVANAHLGIAMGAHAASSTAGVVLTKEDLLGVPAALDLAHATLRKVRQNLAWAFAYNAILIPVAAGLLVAWPLFGSPMRLDPMLAGAAMTLSITSVMLNSLALRKWKPNSGSLAGVSARPTGFPVGSGNPVKV